MITVVLGTLTLGVVINLLPQGQRVATALTNIHGVAFPLVNQEVVVTQALAHLDVQLQEPVLFKALQLSFTYRPATTQTLAVGVRENDFWLSYRPTIFYDAAHTTDETLRTASVTIPLTDKLQDVDRSIDIMFIANQQTTTSLPDETADTTLWYVRDITARVVYARPAVAMVRDYLRSIIYRERPL